MILSEHIRTARKQHVCHYDHRGRPVHCIQPGERYYRCFADDGDGPPFLELKLCVECLQEWHPEIAGKMLSDAPSTLLVYCPSCSLWTPMRRPCRGCYRTDLQPGIHQTREML